MNLSLTPTPFGWEAFLTLPSWKPVCRGRPNARILMRSAEIDVSGKTSPSRAQLRTVEDLLEHEGEVFESVLVALRGYYAETRTRSLRAFSGKRGADTVESPTLMPESLDDQVLCSTVDLNAVFVGPGSRDGVCYALFLFSCDWEPEHGVGIATHGRQVLESQYASDLIQDHRYLDESE
jgi:hypothetical protein